MKFNQYLEAIQKAKTEGEDAAFGPDRKKVKLNPILLFPILRDFPKPKNVKWFKAGEDSFSAVSKAEDFAEKKGYIKGSMERDNPIALAHKVNHIGKWSGIEKSDYKRIHGLLLSKDFRDGDVYLVEF
jgi:hypothetical protein